MDCEQLCMDPGSWETGARHKAGQRGLETSYRKAESWAQISGPGLEVNSRPVQRG